MNKINKQHGFTIIELLIATTIFSVILLLVSFAVLQVGRTYYKGITESTTQGTARSIMDTLAQDIEFSSSIDLPKPAQVITGSYFICIGNHRYTVGLGVQLVDGVPNTLAHQGNNALIEDVPTDCDAGIAPVFPMLFYNARELLAPHMRLTALGICGPGMSDPLVCPNPTPIDSNLYSIYVRVIYGDDDLLNPSLNSCKGGAGSQFCGDAQLNTIVQKRVIQNNE